MDGSHVAAGFHFHVTLKMVRADGDDRDDYDDAVAGGKSDCEGICLGFILFFH